MNKFLNRNASTILTCIGSAGVIMTSVLTAKATPKALCLLANAKEEKREDLTVLETIKVAAPAYIPAILTGASTIACIFGANALSRRQQAALMSAYALLDNSYREYRNKVEELYGEGADKRVIEELAKDKYEECMATDEDGKLLFYDTTMGCYFRSNVERVVMDDGLECYILS